MINSAMFIFYFPDQNIAGGVQDLFYNIISFMTSRSIKVGLIDYKNGNICTRLKSNQRVTIFDIEDPEIRFGKNAIIITNSISKNLLQILKNNHKVNILFYNLYPLSFERIHYYKGKKIPIITSNFTKFSFAKFVSHNAIIFMSSSAILNMSLEKVRIKTEPTIVPIGIDFGYDQAVKISKKSGIVTLGRAELWKQNLFFDLLERLIELGYNDPVTIITDNKKVYNDLLPNSIKQNLEVKILGPVPESALGKYIKNTGKLGVGMGLSALHLIRCGMPTLVIDAVENFKPNDYKYNFLNQKEPFELGEVLKLDSYPKKGFTIEEVLQVYNSIDTLEKNWLKDLACVTAQYSIENTVEGILNNAVKSSMNYSALRFCLPKLYFV